METATKIKPIENFVLYVPENALHGGRGAFAKFWRYGGAELWRNFRARWYVTARDRNHVACNELDGIDFLRAAFRIPGFTLEIRPGVFVSAIEGFAKNW